MKYNYFGWENNSVKAINSEYKGIKTPQDLYDALTLIWCADTCAPRMRNSWSIENRTLGQCSITAFLAQDIFGGKVYGILRDGGNYHCYNVIGDAAFDLTSEQFGKEKLCYEGNPEQAREVHFAKTEKFERYKYLKAELKKLCDSSLFVRHQMRRKDREITDFDTILKMIDACHIVRIGLFDKNEPDFPYIIPLNFGYKVIDGKICLYIHGARAGRKWDLLQQTQYCSVQMDADDGMELIPAARDITERYRCVMGKARVRLLSGDELASAMETCVSRYDECRDFNWNREALSHVAVWELELSAVTAKWNKIKGNAD
ncbi:MAG: pyridoxamine 5'-phosphate oxidase family protein [Treponema sp.]|nr:pyridoxamine 5'-phosphate oxidase family protein [Treponema sp.]